MKGASYQFDMSQNSSSSFLLLEGYNLLMAITLSRGGFQGEVAITLARGALQGHEEYFLPI